jgi:hypothetical protein
MVRGGGGRDDSSCRLRLLRSERETCFPVISLVLSATSLTIAACISFTGGNPLRSRSHRQINGDTLLLEEKAESESPKSRPYDLRDVLLIFLIRLISVSLRC